MITVPETGNTLLRVKLIDRNGDPLDMTDGTATLYWRIGTGARYESGMSVETPATGGIVNYRFPTGALVPGLLIADVVAVDQNSYRYPIQNPIQLRVRNLV